VHATARNSPGDPEAERFPAAPTARSLSAQANGLGSRLNRKSRGQGRPIAFNRLDRSQNQNGISHSVHIMNPPSA